jgi:hypothetical protein
LHLPSGYRAHARLLRLARMLVACPIKMGWTCFPAVLLEAHQSFYDLFALRILVPGE